MKAKQTNAVVYGALISMVVLSSGSVLFAGTVVGGFITTDTHWTTPNSPYVVAQSILVTDGAALTIDPGVEVRFEPDIAMSIVSGKLVARGTNLSPIRFTANATAPVQAGDHWAYIGFGDSSLDAGFDGAGNYISGSILEHCEIEYAGGTNVKGVVNIESASPYLARSTIRNNSTGAVYAKYAGGLRIEGNLIAANDTGNTTTISGGAYLYKSNNAIIADNTFTENHTWYDGGAIYLNYSDNVSVADNIIQNNSAGYHGGGVHLTRTDNVTISDNVITGNDSSGTQFGGGGVYDFESVGASIVGNTIADNTAHRGGGVYLQGSAGIVFADNVISGNEADVDGSGVSMEASWSVTFSHDSIVDNLGHGLFAYRYGSGKGSGIVLSLDHEHPTSIHGNLGYEVWNNMDFVGASEPTGTSNIDARWVWWATEDDAEIRANIFDFFDDPSKGIVFYDPYAIPEPCSASILIVAGAVTFMRPRRRR